MADEDPTKTEDPPERTVPYARFKEINDKLADERRSRSELEAKVEQLSDRDKTDVERLTKDLERAQKRIEDAEQRATQAEVAQATEKKSAWLASAAAKHNFHNPDVASQMLSLDDIEDATAAEKAVKALAKDNQWLVKSEQKVPPLQRVGIAGTEDEKTGQQLVTEEQLQRQWGTEMLEKMGIAPTE